MADIAQAVVAGGMGIAGVAIGAGLTYWLGALNRRHQEEREDKTRWYEARLQAYLKLNEALDDMTVLLFHPEEPPTETRWDVMEDFHSAQSTVSLVGSNDVFDEVERLSSVAARILDGPRPPTDEDKHLWATKVYEMKHHARIDLGYADMWWKPRWWAEDLRERQEYEARKEHERRKRREKRRERVKKLLAWRPRHL
jgi:hypothetical protein